MAIAHIMNIHSLFNNRYHIAICQRPETWRRFEFLKKKKSNPKLNLMSGIKLNNYISKLLQNKFLALDGYKQFWCDVVWINQTLMVLVCIHVSISKNIQLQAVRMLSHYSRSKVKLNVRVGSRDANWHKDLFIVVRN